MAKTTKKNKVRVEAEGEKIFKQVSTILLFHLLIKQVRLLLGHLLVKWDLKDLKKYSLCGTNGS